MNLFKGFFWLLMWMTPIGLRFRPNSQPRFWLDRMWRNRRSPSGRGLVLIADVYQNIAESLFGTVYRLPRDAFYVRDGQHIVGSINQGKR